MNVGRLHSEWKSPVLAIPAQDQDATKVLTDAILSRLTFPPPGLGEEPPQALGRVWEGAGEGTWAWGGSHQK